MGGLARPGRPGEAGTGDTRQEPVPCGPLDAAGRGVYGVTASGVQAAQKVLGYKGTAAMFEALARRPRPGCARPQRDASRENALRAQRGSSIL
jgi:hypothetical protein